MIDPGELILGAYVMHEEKLMKIEENDFVENYFLGVIEPVPLTEQWLIDLGFHERDSGRYYEKNGIGFICGYAVDGSFVASNSFGPRHIHVYHVHVLQGLHYFLTGKLLTK